MHRTVPCWYRRQLCAGHMYYISSEDKDDGHCDQATLRLIHTQRRDRMARPRGSLRACSSSTARGCEVCRMLYSDGKATECIFAPSSCLRTQRQLLPTAKPSSVQFFMSTDHIAQTTRLYSTSQTIHSRPGVRRTSSSAVVAS